MKRRGMVVLVVTVVVVMLSLAGLSFVVTMSAENKGVHIEADQLRLEHVVGSGAELLKVFLEQSWTAQEEAGGSWDNAEVFAGVVVLDEGEGGRQGRFSVVSPRSEGGASPSGIRFGVENESARLNLGVLLQWEEKLPGSAQRALMSLPGMTEALADAILDWLDADDSPRSFGAETPYYQGLAVPYSPRNGVPQCLEEILLVRGMTRELLYGPDANLNRQIDPEEQREGSSGGAGAQGIPWADLLTVSSAERNQSADGTPRIDLNQEDLVALHEELMEFSPQWADFVVLYRQFGPYEGTAEAGGEWSGSLPTKAAEYKVESLLDLVDAKVQIPAEGEGEPVTVASPLSNGGADFKSLLPQLFDRTTTESGPAIYGRVNVNLAPREVLLAVPGMEPAMVEQILTSRRSSGRGDAERRTPAWLLTQGVFTLQQAKAVFPYLSGGGDVFRGQIIGFFGESSPSLRVETVIDATANPPRQVYWKDLRLLGRGYHLESLGATNGARPRR
jgi:DNA uptake protein ComE-like DNA-binding protein